MSSLKRGNLLTNASTSFKNRRILIDMMTLYTATRQHMIKINFMYLIIQRKIISCNKFSFFKKKYFDNKKSDLWYI